MIEAALSRAKHLMAAHADWLSVAAAVVITILSFLPRSTAAGVPVNDLVNHFIAYAGLSSLALYNRRSVAAALFALALVIGLGGIIEIIQPYAGRAGELADFFANGLGALAGAVAVIIFRRWTGQQA